jgi:hypothetical protein
MEPTHIAEGCGAGMLAAVVILALGVVQSVRSSSRPCR